MTAVLTAENIDKHYDGVHALKNVDFKVADREVHALIGENGAGKSTLGKIIAGVVKPDSGRMDIDGKPAPISSPTDAQRLGISIIFQELDLFGNLTVAENIVVGNLRAERGRFVNFRQLDRYCQPYLKQVGLDCPGNTMLGELAIGQMQLVAIARALSMSARLIVMDEPTSSLSDDAVEILFGLIRRLTETDVSVIYVSHKMDEIFRIADRITVLRDGCYIGTRKAGETSIDELIEMMVGRAISDTQRGPRRAETRSATVKLSVRNLTTPRLRNISFDLCAGQVLGIAGLVGAGRSELGAALFGLDKIISGTIETDGRPINPRSPRIAIDHGIGLLPEDRKLQGLMMKMSAKENTSMAILPALQQIGFISRKDERRRVEKVHRTVSLKAPSPDAAISTLSGGNQQKALLARWLLVNPEVFFLDDPTRGIDVGAKQDIYKIIERLAASGKAVILVSSELPELLRCCDRIMVLHGGENMGILDAAEATQERIMALATKSVA